MPFFLLMGGEFVVAFLLARIGLWILGARRREDAPVPPPGPGRPRLIEGGASLVTTPPRASARLRRAA